MYVSSIAHVFCVCCEVIRAVQVALIRAGRAGEVVAETRGWDDAAQVTRGQRSKEGLADYRFFAEPDLPPLAITEQYLGGIRVRGALAAFAALAAAGLASPQPGERPSWRTVCLPGEASDLGLPRRTFLLGRPAVCRTVPSLSRLHRGLSFMLRPPLGARPSPPLSGTSSVFIATPPSFGKPYCSLSVCSRQHLRPIGRERSPQEANCKGSRPYPSNCCSGGWPPHLRPRWR